MDVIQNLVDAYNHSRHHSIGMAQSDVKKKYENHLWVRLFGDGEPHLTPQILQGVIVRSNSNKPIFDKGYMPN